MYMTLEKDKSDQIKNSFVKELQNVIADSHKNKWWKDFVEIYFSDSIFQNWVQKTYSFPLPVFPIPYEEREENTRQIIEIIPKESFDSNNISQTFSLFLSRKHNSFRSNNENNSLEVINSIVATSIVLGINKNIELIMTAILTANPEETFAFEDFQRIFYSNYYQGIKPNNLQELNEIQQKFWNLLEKCNRCSRNKWRKIYEYEKNEFSLLREIVILLIAICAEELTEIEIRSINRNTISADNYVNNVIPDNLVLLLNPQDYLDFKENEFLFNTLEKYCKNIYPISKMKKGYIRLFDKRSLKIKFCMQNFIFKTSLEAISYMYFEINFSAEDGIFSNFVNCLFVPKNC